MLNIDLVINIFIYIAVSFFILFLFFNEKIINFNFEALKDFILDSGNMSFVTERLRKIIKLILNLVEAVLIAGILVVFIQKFYIGNFIVPTKSMMPLIFPGDRVFANMCVYKFFRPQRNDILIFQEPINNSIFFAKRLVGLSGDRVKIEDNKLYINNRLYKDSIYSGIFSNSWKVPEKRDIVEIYFEGDIENSEDREEVINKILEKELQIKFMLNGKETGMLLELLNYDKVFIPLIRGKKVKLMLKKNYYFVLGDNTEESFDSRMWGFISEDRIKGKIFFKFWPFENMERI
jgi:signal peptidase I